ncbi:MAG: apolipoprotein N-acyltransferase, partial [Candidatus Omnitrophota bacterium]
AFYYAIFGLAFFSLRKLNTALTLLATAACWVALEYVRSHFLGGLGWALLGYSQYRYLPVIQVSDTTGAYGVSFLIMLVNVGLWRALENYLSPLGNRQKLPKQICASLIYPALFLSIALAYGYLKLQESAPGPEVKVALIQGNIEQPKKWNPEFVEDILGRYTYLSETVVAESPELIIWPETSVPGFLENEPNLLEDIRLLSRRLAPAHLLLGAPNIGADDKIYNSAYLIDAGEFKGRYDKLHLVPFGEFIPLAKFFSRFDFAGLIAGFSPGEDYTVFSLRPDARFSVLICFEDIFGSLVRHFVQKGARFLVNITNDAWFYDSSEPEQHLQASVFRAVENRVNVVRSANTGISCIIDPWGRILKTVADDRGREVMVEGTASGAIILANLPSFYTRYGDLFAWLCIVISLFSLAQRNRKP